MYIKYITPSIESGVGQRGLNIMGRLNLEYIKVTMLMEGNGVKKGVNGVLWSLLDQRELGAFQNRCHQGIEDEFNAGAPVLAWSSYNWAMEGDNTEGLEHSEIWAVQAEDYGDFMDELSSWLRSPVKVIYSTWWYRQLLYAHIEMYQLSELFTNEFFIELVGKAKK